MAEHNYTNGASYDSKHCVIHASILALFHHRHRPEAVSMAEHNYTTGASNDSTVWSMLHSLLCSVPGTVQQNMGDLSYIVEDATGHIERIWREDIISDYDDNAPPLQVWWKLKF